MVVITASTLCPIFIRFVFVSFVFCCVVERTRCGCGHREYALSELRNLTLHSLRRFHSRSAVALKPTKHSPPSLRKRLLFVIIRNPNHV